MNGESHHVERRTPSPAARCCAASASAWAAASGRDDPGCRPRAVSRVPRRMFAICNNLGLLPMSFSLQRRPRLCAVELRQDPAGFYVMIDNGGSERSMEYDTVSDKYVQFVEEEAPAPRRERGGREAVQGPRGPDDSGRQFRRCGGADYGLVPDGSLSPCAHVFGNIREPAPQPGSSARRL